MPDPAAPPEPFLKPCPQCWASNRVRADYHDHACTTGQIPTCGACGCDLFNYGTAFQVFLDARRAADSGSAVAAPGPGSAIAGPYAPGDHLRVRRFHKDTGRPFDHHGIYAGNDEVIEYDGPVSSGKVRLTTLADFQRSGEPVDVVRSDLRYAPADVVARARTRLGEQRYSLVFQNCEHFAYWCRSGKSRSEQVENAAIAAVVTPLYLAYKLFKGGDHA